MDKMELLPEQSESRFSAWGLPAEIVKRLTERGITTPTDVQERCWGPVAAGRDLLVQSPTGTGKTLAFALPIMNKLAGNEGVEVLVVLPTRELAMQVAGVFGFLGVQVALLYGGSGYNQQFAALAKNSPVVVGTPGRICDHISRGSLKLKTCHTLVLDEADEMLDMGFAEDLERINEMLPSKRQSLLFSATMLSSMEELASKTLRSPERIAVSTGLTVASEIGHYAYEVEREHRQDALSNILHVEQPNAAIIFCHTKAETEELAERLIGEGFKAATLHGDMAQAERSRTLNSFRRRSIELLVATDVAARGIDVRGISHVFNLAVPRSAEIYIHRVGRTGRAGEAGKAITLVAPRDAGRFRRLLQSAHISLETVPIPQADEVKQALRQGLHAQLCKRLEVSIDPAYTALAGELLAYMEPQDALAALLSTNEQARAVICGGLTVPIPKKRVPREPRTQSEKSSARREKPRPRRNMVNIQINVGRRDGYEPVTLLKLLVEASGRPAVVFDSLEVQAHSSFVKVPEEHSEAILKSLSAISMGNGHLKARPAKDKVASSSDASSKRRGPARAGGRDYRGPAPKSRYRPGQHNRTPSKAGSGRPRSGPRR